MLTYLQVRDVSVPQNVSVFRHDRDLHGGRVVGLVALFDGIRRIKREAERNEPECARLILKTHARGAVSINPRHRFLQRKPKTIRDLKSGTATWGNPDVSHSHGHLHRLVLLRKGLGDRKVHVRRHSIAGAYSEIRQDPCRNRHEARQHNRGGAENPPDLRKSMSHFGSFPLTVIRGGHPRRSMLRQSQIQNTGRCVITRQSQKRPASARARAGQLARKPEPKAMPCGALWPAVIPVRQTMRQSMTARERQGTGCHLSPGSDPTGR